MIEFARTSHWKYGCFSVGSLVLVLRFIFRLLFSGFLCFVVWLLFSFHFGSLMLFRLVHVLSGNMITRNYYTGNRNYGIGHFSWCTLYPHLSHHHYTWRRGGAWVNIVLYLYFLLAYFWQCHNPFSQVSFFSLCLTCVLFLWCSRLPCFISWPWVYYFFFHNAPHYPTSFETFILYNPSF
jgi:hypothetical protein